VLPTAANLTQAQYKLTNYDYTARISFDEKKKTLVLNCIHSWARRAKLILSLKTAIFFATGETGIITCLRRNGGSSIP